MKRFIYGKVLLVLLLFLFTCSIFGQEIPAESQNSSSSTGDSTSASPENSSESSSSSISSSSSSSSAAAAVVAPVSIDPDNSIFTTDTTKKDYVPYGKDEFPPFLYEARRWEVLFFGSIPISYLYSRMGGAMYLNSSGRTMSSSDSDKFYLATTLGISAGIVLADWIIRKIIHAGP